VRWARVGVSRWPTSLVQNQVFAIVSALWIARHRAALDLVHANGFITWAKADVNAAHYVHSAWLKVKVPDLHSGNRVRAAYQRLYSWLNSKLERWAYRRSGRVVAVSEAVKRQLLVLGVDAERVRVIPNGVDTDEFRPREDASARDRSGAEIRGLFIGDLRTPRKNLHTVLRALAHSSRVTLDVVGDAEGSPYPEFAASLGIAQRVRFLGFRRDVPQLMRAADFVVFPSLYEPSGLVLFEAAASGVPAVTARSVGGVELLGEECAIVLDDPEDAMAMGAAFQRLAASPELRSSLGRAGRCRVMNLDFATMGERYCALYCEVLGMDRPSAARDSASSG
jgi:glycosyltransferase involved in cell wall biosynthesis